MKKTIDSFGFIEVHGFVAGIEAADAMLKSAQVRLLKQQEVRPGLVTLVVEGDLAACRAAVNAGVAAASRVGLVVSSHVIGRPSGDTKSMVMTLIGGSSEDNGSSKADSLAKVAPTEVQTESVPSLVIESSLSTESAPIESKSEAKMPVFVNKGNSKKTVEKQQTEVVTHTDDETQFTQVLGYIDSALRGRSWVEITRRFTDLSVYIHQKLDEYVATGELKKVGARYRKPADKE